MSPLRHDESGMTLIELLIALVVLALGISAVVAGFSSGLFAINRAHQASSAAVIADAKMENFRRGPWTAPPSPATTTGATQAGNDGRTYWVGTTVGPYCANGGTPSGGSCSGTPTTYAIKIVSIEVRANVAGCTTGAAATCSGKLFIREDSTFDPSTS